MSGKITDMENDLTQTRNRLSVEHLRNAEKERTLLHTLEELNPESGNKTAISSQIKATLAGDSDWDKFLVTYADADPRFVETLCERHPDMTKTELKMACMIRMGVDSKQMAKTLGVNPDTVKKYRQRLRGRLQIDSSVKLSDYLKSIGE